jgi:hypothetical protein
VGGLPENEEKENEGGRFEVNIATQMKENALGSSLDYLKKKTSESGPAAR